MSWLEIFFGKQKHKLSNTSTQNTLSRISEGFYIGDKFLPWGTELSEIHNSFPCSKKTDRSAEINITEIQSIEALTVDVYANAINRPIQGVHYQIKHSSTMRNDEDIINKIAKKYGKPKLIEKQNISFFPNPSNGVRCTAKWNTNENVILGLSIFGAPREVNGGLSSALFNIQWLDEKKAALPYLSELEKADDLLKTYAEDATIELIITTEKTQSPYYVPDYYLQNPHMALNDKALRKAQIALHNKKLSNTPNSIAKLIEENQIAIWKNDKNKIWGVSIKLDTIFFPTSIKIDLNHDNILPAKGSGSSSLSLSGFIISDPPNSSALKAIADFLIERNYVNYEYHESYNC